MIDGLKADVVTLAIAYDIDQIAELTELVSQGLAEALAEQQLPLHVDDRVPGPQGQSEGDQGLGRPGEGRRRGHHAESEDLRRRPVQLPGRLGLRAASTTTTTKRRPSEFVTALYKNVPVLDSGARGSTTTFVQREIGDVLLAWENEALLGDQGARPGQVRNGRPVGQHPGRAAGDGGRQERGGARRDGSRQGVPRIPLHAGGPEDRRPSTTIVRASRSMSTRQC